MQIQEVRREICLPYALKSWQKEVKFDPHRFKVIAAGARSGKTTLAVDWLVTSAPQDDMSLGDSMSWYVAPTYTSAEDIAWAKLKGNIRPLQDQGLVKRIYEGDMSVELYRGQWIQLKGGDKPDSLRGVKLRRLVLDEPQIMKPEVWEEVLQPRTSDYLAPVMFIGTPKGYNWFYDLTKKENENPGDWKTFRIKTSEAGTLKPEEIARAKRDMDPRVFRQEYEASFETFGGQVFSDFDRKKHVAEKQIAFAQGTEYALGMDFGWSSPTVVLFINVFPNEDVQVFHELGRRETSMPQISLDIKNLPQIKGMAQDAYKRPIDALPTLIGCDPAGDSRSESLGTSSVEELRNIFGYNKVQYRRNYPGIIQDGISQIRKWLRNGKLKISPTCTNLIQAFEMYRYPDPKGDIQSEQPLKDGISDHWIDALRYFFLNRFPVQQTTARAI